MPTYVNITISSWERWRKRRGKREKHCR